MNYKERLQDFLEILNHTQNTCEYHKDSFVIPIEIQSDTIFISWLDGEYDYMLVSSDEENNTFVTIDDGVDETVYKKVALNTREQYISLCNELMDRVLSLTVSSAHTYYYEAGLESYIHKFAKKLKSEWNCFKDVSLSSMPIYITGQDAHDDNGEYGNIEVHGDYKNYSGLITVRNVRSETKEADETTARHETIHYMLACAGLPFSDDSSIFWFFATIYNAAPYKEMDEDNKNCFDLLTAYYKTKGKDDIETSLSQLIDNLKKSA